MIIGISGKKKCGKDTIAEIIQELYPNFIITHFADALKLEVAQATGFSVDYINTHKDNFRLILQGWGTDFRRKIYSDDYWLKKTDEFISPVNIHKDFIISDVRFQNEVDYVKSHNGILIRVERHLDYSDSHISETALDSYDKWDYKIVNDGTILELKEQVQQLNILPKE